MALGPETEKQVRIAVVVGMLAALVNAWLFTPATQIIDDAFIFFRYADNFVAGHGLTWNPDGERVEGYTSPLYLAVVVLVRALRLEPVAAVTVFNVGCFVLLVGSSLELLRLLAPSRASLLLGPLLVGAHTYFAQMARAGMEPILFLLLLTWSLVVFLRRERPVLSGMLFALTALARPESVACYATCVAWAAARERRALRPFVLAEARRLGGFLLLVVPHLLWRHAYYGEWLPNTYYAKVSVESWAQLGRGLVACSMFLTRSRGALLQVALACAIVAPRERTRTLLIALLLVWVAYLLSLGLHDWNYYYSAPLDLFAILLVASAVGALIEGGADVLSRRRIVVLPLALYVVTMEMAYRFLQGSPLRGVLVVATAAPLVFYPRRRWSRVLPALVLMLFVDAVWWQEPHQRYDVLWNNVAIGKKLREIAKPTDTLAIPAAGAVPYYSGLVTYDTLGLNDRHIARVPVKDPARLGFGHERGDGAYILSKKPTYLAPTYLRSMAPGEAPWWPWLDESLTEAFATDEFKRDYHFEQVPLEGGGYFKFYERNDG